MDSMVKVNGVLFGFEKGGERLLILGEVDVDGGLSFGHWLGCYQPY